MDGFVFEINLKPFSICNISQETKIEVAKAIFSDDGKSLYVGQYDGSLVYLKYADGHWKHKKT